LTARERYDGIIQKIEEMVSTQCLQANEIADTIANDQNMSKRDLATVLGFLTGEQLNNYIRSRKYQAAYKFLIDAKTRGIKRSKAISRALEIADMKEQASLNKAFIRMFDITPGAAYHEQDASRLRAPKSWAEISNEATIVEEIAEVCEESETIFGIDRALYDRITKINDLEAFYGLPREYSVVAVKLSDVLNIKLEDAFGYVEGFKSERDFILDDEESTIEEINAVLADEWLWENASNPDLIYCCITCGISVSSAIWIVHELPSLGYGSIPSLSPLFIRTFQEDYPIHSRILMKACEYYEAHTNDTYTDADFAEFLDQIQMDKPIEIAFENMQYAKECDDDEFFAHDFLPEYAASDEMEFETWASQEFGNHGPRFDEEYDPDNPNHI